LARVPSSANEKPRCGICASGALQLLVSCPARCSWLGLCTRGKPRSKVSIFLYRPGGSRDQFARAASAEPCPRAGARAASLSGGVILPPHAVDPCDVRPHNPAVLPYGVIRPWPGACEPTATVVKGISWTDPQPCQGPEHNQRLGPTFHSAISRTWPGLSWSRAWSSAGTSGRRSGSRLDGARRTTRATGRSSSRCCEGMLLSTVTRMSNRPAIASRSRPFVRSAQPKSITLATS
jgi:hypothetical protein